MLSRNQYHMIESVLYYIETDKSVCLIPPEYDRRELFEEAHSGAFGAHLRYAKVRMENYQNTTGGPR